MYVGVSYIYIIFNIHVSLKYTNNTYIEKQNETLTTDNYAIVLATREEMVHLWGWSTLHCCGLIIKVLLYIMNDFS